MIATPITYCAEDLALVRAFRAESPEAQPGSYWADPSLESLRSRVKTFYIAAQNTRCCYCNRHLGTDNHRMWDVEHIVPRSRHARFMFEPANLAASCPDCNNEKADKDSLVNTKRKTYPRNSDAFRIVHPHFDRFEDHIHQIRMVYLPKPRKEPTPYTCAICCASLKNSSLGKIVRLIRVSKRKLILFSMRKRRPRRPLTRS